MKETERQLSFWPCLVGRDLVSAPSWAENRGDEQARALPWEKLLGTNRGA
ncbi:MAG: hypothetical protein KKG09_10245 [Verrucomicrobia bacterium]|nr:hypothetical protein [Verrucomicrobiota bacterium]MBU4247739.1 hypothetical protein [Verrucomicrobiota bacterium]MBU4291609.1 hypothetical protein [Verrucomicrobiota bacterium]MBU4498372.1 hypothetical protein [Verrucomicrobiota bacterium]MCG2681859.1 hypothetical protein [Kiritimatiellia bacterium]